ncbi:tail fiber protein [Xanthomonas sp. 3498]|uniref:phage tail protein n=1 Tax=Xanthomonas sp. 3498 TaxID=2663863 RepID=UPI00161B2464|nr:tail fiber protein [Xanthomonas sp. 3498]MBB5878173.1 microcystin-dependent protein [Xanthomonas sp. 3498]
MSSSFIGEVRAFTYNFAPEGWLDCLGQVVSLQQYQALFGVIGFTYGGDGRTTFGLPDLRGRAALGQGQGVGLSTYAIGQLQGSDGVVLASELQLPAHTHAISSKYMAPGVAPGASGKTPSASSYASRLLNPTTSPPTTYTPFMLPGPPLDAQMSPAALSAFPDVAALPQAHENRQPFATLRYCICATDGVFPPRP